MIRLVLLSWSIAYALAGPLGLLIMALLGIAGEVLLYRGAGDERAT